MIIRHAEPPANVENRFVRLCNTYDDMIGFLSFGALGLVPPPSFCDKVVAYRNHLSLAGVIIADMVSFPKPPALQGPVPSTHKAKKPGCITWAEVESRGYIFGAVKPDQDQFSNAFLDELKARPDLFHLIIQSEDTDPKGQVEHYGLAADKMSTMRARNFEAPRASPDNRPIGYGDWMIYRSAKDILYGTDEQCLGYLTNLNRRSSVGWLFHFKKFPVRYFVVIDPVPNRHHTSLVQQLAWAALRVKGHGRGEFEPNKYAKASDAFFDKCASERLSWMPKETGGWSTTEMVP